MRNRVLGGLMRRVVWRRGGWAWRLLLLVGVRDVVLMMLKLTRVVMKAGVVDVRETKEKVVR